MPFLINRAVNIEAMRTKGPPRPGDLLICQGCYTPNIVVEIKPYDGEFYTGLVRPPTMEERRLIDGNIEVQTIIASMKANQGGTGMAPIGYG